MKFSIITAVYNSEATVKDAIRSVATQTYREIEHLIVDGQSTDGSLEAIATMHHDGLQLFSEPDQGIYDALNKGIGRATGDIVGFVHSDDMLANNAVLARIATAFEDPEIEAVFGDLNYVTRQHTSQIVRHWSTGAFHPEKLRRGWMPAHPTLYVKRNVYDRYGLFDTSYKIAADYDFILRYFSQSRAKKTYLPEVLYKMRMGGVSNRSLSKIAQKMREDRRALRENKIGGLPTLAWKNLSKLGQFVKRPGEKSP